MRIMDKTQELPPQRPRVTVSWGLKDLLNVGVPDLRIRAALASLTNKLKTFRALTQWKFPFSAHIKVWYSSP